MASSSDGQIRGLDFSGYFRARVVNNVDTKMEGRLGLFIPALITEVPNNLEAPKASKGTISKTLFANSDELSLPQQVKKDNYIWARPASFLVENGGSAGNHGGSYKIPTVGSMVRVYFEGNDPNKPYWVLGSPTVTGDVIAGTNMGKGTNVANAAANWADPAKRVNMHMIAEYDNGNAIYADSNADNNAFVIRWANGHTFSIGHAAESGIIMQTEKGHVIQLDENSTEIRIKTHTGQSQIVISDTGDITVTNTGDTTVNTKGNVNINAQAAINLVAQAGVNLSSAGGSPTVVKSSGPMTVMSPKISLKGM